MLPGQGYHFTKTEFKFSMMFHFAAMAKNTYAPKM
jgi:hypothetical protein